MAQFNVDSEVINEALTRAGVNYADTEQANASMFVG